MFASAATAAILALCALVPAAQADGVTTVKNVLLETDISRLIQQGPRKSTCEAARTFVSTRIPKTLAKRIFGLVVSSSDKTTCENKDHACELTTTTLLESQENLNLNMNRLDITTLTESTNCHIDAVMDEDNMVVCEDEDTVLEPQMVAFIPLEENPDAVFVHGEEEIPIEKGTMIKFDGRIAHHTQIRSGNVADVNPVRMLGPFTWQNGIGFARTAPAPEPPDDEPQKGKKSKTSGPRSAKTSGPKSAKSGAVCNTD